MPTSNHGSATFNTSVVNPAIGIVAVDGELDITNVTDFVGTASDMADDSNRIVIDLRGVEFFGTAGFAALHELSTRYTEGGTPWAVVPSRNVRRVVLICDTDKFVPMHSSLAAALDAA